VSDAWCVCLTIKQACGVYRLVPELAESVRV
jgi:hypothetical protein